MGLISCVVFFATFRATSLSIAGALGVVTWAAFKLRGSLRDKPMSLQAWRQYKNKAVPILIGGCGALSVLLGLWILRRRGSSAISPR
ncbi:MAG TPA: hypothetical protein VKC58_07155 [Myxococcales bacterium]|nr:hypothetical protein [Myxococcales bacterium]